MSRIRKDVTVNGKTTRLAAASTDDMINKLCAIIAQQNTTPAEKPIESPLFTDYMAQWYSLYCEKRMKPTTLACIRGYMKNHYGPAFKDLHLHEFDPQIIQEFLNDRSHMAKKTLKDMLMWLRQILDYAVEDGYLARNPAHSKRVKIPSQKVTERVALTREEFEDIHRNLSKLQPKDALFIALAMYTGMRRGEILGLKDTDIDYDEGVIHVRRSATYPRVNRAIVDTPKTHSGYRKIPILSMLMPFLPKTQEDRYLFEGEIEGEPLSHQQLVNTMKRIKRTIDLHGATPHSLRHTFITFMNNSGMDIKTIQTIAGHASADITMNRYTHAQDSQLKTGAERMENWLQTA